MPADPCLVTVRAGPAASKGYENFVANKLKDEVLKEITSNLQDDLKEEALNAFKASVQDGWSKTASVKYRMKFFQKCQMREISFSLNLPTITNYRWMRNSLFLF